jgi:hypothetical protein
LSQLQPRYPRAALALHLHLQATSNYWLQTLTGVSLFCASVLGLAAPGTNWYNGASSQLADSPVSSS